MCASVSRPVCLWVIDIVIVPITMNNLVSTTVNIIAVCVDVVFVQFCNFLGDFKTMQLQATKFIPIREFFNNN